MQVPVTQLPSYVFLSKSLKEFIPDSLQEPNTAKLRSLYSLLTFILKEQEIDISKSLGEIT
jgi:hypothetical protein